MHEIRLLVDILTIPQPSFITYDSAGKVILLIVHVTPPSDVVGVVKLAPDSATGTEDQVVSGPAKVMVVLTYVWSAIVGEQLWHSTEASKLCQINQSACTLVLSCRIFN